jgi:prefoldin subunit 5
MWKDEAGVTQIDFNQFRSDKAYAHKKIIEIGNDIGIPVSQERAVEILDTCLNKDTKTKVKRDKSVNLWNDEAKAIYTKLQDRQKFYDFAYPIYWSAKSMLSKS